MAIVSGVPNFRIFTVKLLLNGKLLSGSVTSNSADHDEIGFSSVK